MAQWIEDPQGRLEVEKVTKELKLPVWKANHKGKFREFWNELWDKIEDYCLKLKEGSKKTDDRLNSALGRNDGDFPIANAVVGNVYYSALTKKYYKCKVGGPAPMPNGNFIDMSILENLNRLENLIKTDTYGAQNGGYFQLFNRIIIYGSFNYIFGSSSIQNFEIRESIKNWENANVICSWREINLNLTNTTVSALMTSPTTLSIKSNVLSSGRGTVSYLIIARV